MICYSDRYCNKCEKWYIPRNVGECNRCPSCGKKVYGDE